MGLKVNLDGSKVTLTLKVGMGQDQLVMECLRSCGNCALSLFQKTSCDMR